MPANRKVLSIANTEFSITADHDGHEVVLFVSQPATVKLPSAVGFSSAITVKHLAMEGAPEGAVVLLPQREQTIDGSREAYCLDKPIRSSGT